MVGGVGLSAASASPARSSATPTEITDAGLRILADTNAARTTAALPPLTRNPAMDAVAQSWAEQLARAGTLSHNPSTGSQIPAGWSRWGENVAQGYTFRSVVGGWLGSTGHRANILGDFTDIGIGWVVAGGTTYAVQVFAKYATRTAAGVPTTPAPIVVGNRLVDSRTGRTWTAHAVNWPSFEYACQQGWAYSSDGATAAAAAAMASWGITAVRLPLNEACWLGIEGSPAYGTATGYRSAIQSWVAKLNAAGLVVILDLHWSSPPGRAADGQLAMADSRSVTFWQQVGSAYASNRSVMFDLFNEPYSRGSSTLSWTCWRDGGCPMPVENDTTPLSGATYTTAGMAQLVAAVRGAGAAQPILLAGLDYANDLRGWLANRPADSQLVASWHNYQAQRCRTESCWNADILPVAAQVPVIATEFGQTDGGNGFLTAFMTWADANGIGYAPWAWWAVDASESLSASRYALITDLTTFAPKAPAGTAVHAHLAAFAAQAAGLRTNTLVKTAASPTVYFVDGSSGLIPITSFDIAAQYGVTGYTTVSPNALVGRTVAPAALTTRATCDSTSYLASRGTLTRLAPGAFGMTTTALSAAACAALPVSTAAPVARLYVRSPDGVISRVIDGMRRPAASMAALVADNGGVVPAWFDLPAAGLADIPIGPPLLPPGQLVKTSTRDTVYFIDGPARLVPITSFDIATQFGAVGFATVAPSAIEGYAVATSPLTTTVTCGSSAYLAAGGSLVALAAGAFGMPSTALDPATCSAIPVRAGVPVSRLYLRTPDGVIARVASGTRLPATSMAALIADNAGTVPTWFDQPFAAVAALPLGRPLIATNQLIKASNSPTVYFVDGPTRLVPITSFEVAAQFGSVQYTTVDPTVIAGSTVASAPLSIFARCGAETLVAGGGAVRAIAPERLGAIAPTELSAEACAALTTRPASTGALFLRIPDGRIFSIEAGVRRLAPTWEALLRANGGVAPAWIDTAAPAVLTIPAGPDLP